MKKNWKKVLVGTLCLVGFLLLLVKGNQFEKVSLISTEGQSYEKAVVTKITKDNLAEDGNRYGTQEVRVQVKSGAYAGEELDAVNPSGSLSVPQMIMLSLRYTAKTVLWQFICLYFFSVW